MRRRVLWVFAVLLLPVHLAWSGPILISEVLYDAAGKDDGGTFVEIFGPPGLGLAGYTLEAINGSGGAVSHRVDLAGLVIPADGFLLLADELTGGGTLVAEADVLVTNLDLQNGPDSLRILFGGGVVDALGYGSFGPGLVFAGEGTPADGVGPGTSLARWFADVDTDDNSRDFRGLATPSPGAGDLAAVVPEPGGIVLLGTGLLGTGAFLLAISLRRRRGRSTGRCRFESR